MRAAVPLAERYGLIRTHGTLLVAAVIAAHGASGRGGGFRPSDVRFFFYLFSNWLEHDLLRAAEPMELTQVRRFMQRLQARGWARTTARQEPRARSRSTHALTPDGLVELVDLLTSDLDGRTFEQSLFVACFAFSYRAAILARTPPGRRRQVASSLDAERLLRASEARVLRVIVDLRERVHSSLLMRDEAVRLRETGATDAEIVGALDRRDAYQLQHVRPFAEVMRSLPADLLRFELAQGIDARARLLFKPMARVARAQRTILRDLRAAVIAR